MTKKNAETKVYPYMFFNHAGKILMFSNLVICKKKKVLKYAKSVVFGGNTIFWANTVVNSN